MSFVGDVHVVSAVLFVAMAGYIVFLHSKKHIDRIVASFEKHNVKDIAEVKKVVDEVKKV